MEPRKERGTERLRLGRQSIPGARYFVTLCVKDRRIAWRDGECGDEGTVFLDTVAAMEAAGDWAVLALCIMPDHVHVLFRLGERLALDRVLAKIKAKGRSAQSEWTWQANFFEHRLRADEDSEDYARYIFLNPYRAGLIRADQTWWGWRVGVAVESAKIKPWRFLVALNADGTPPIEWVGERQTVPWEKGAKDGEALPR